MTITNISKGSIGIHYLDRYITLLPEQKFTLSGYDEVELNQLRSLERDNKISIEVPKLGVKEEDIKNEGVCIDEDTVLGNEFN